MLKRFLHMCKLDIEATITLPTTGFFVKNYSSCRFCYIIKGKRHYINLASPQEYSSFFKTYRIVDFVTYKRGNLSMYHTTVITTVGSDGKPVQRKKMALVTLEEIDLTAVQVQGIAAEYEMSKNKVIKRFINEVFKAA